MSREVRIGRTERKIARNALSKTAIATKLRHKKSTKQRSARFGDLGEVVEAVITGKPTDLDAVIAVLQRHFYYGGIAEKHFADAIFDPALGDFTRLPMGVVDQKEELLPPKLIPKTPSALRAHCERMIVLSQEEELINTVAAGWPGTGGGKERFQQHLFDLNHLREHHTPLYRALVSGRHRIVVLALRNGQYGQQGRRLLDGFEIERLRRALICHALIWCCHDIQLILARNALAERTPLGNLISSDHVALAPERVMNEARDWRPMLDFVVESYRGHVPDRSRNRDENETDFSAHPTVGLLRTQIEFQAKTRGIDPEQGFERLNELLDGIAERLTDPDADFFRQSAEDRTENSMEKSFHAMWFSRLSCVQASAVPILRYVQAEQRIGALLDELVPVSGRMTPARAGVALSAFDKAGLRRGSNERARNLLYVYRRAILDDKDLMSRSKDGARDKASGEGAIVKAGQFLKECGERLIVDHHGPQDLAARTFYLLDIIPEWRLAV